MTLNLDCALLNHNRGDLCFSLTAVHPTYPPTSAMCRAAKKSFWETAFREHIFICWRLPYMWVVSHDMNRIFTVHPLLYSSCLVIMQWEYDFFSNWKICKSTQNKRVERYDTCLPFWQSAVKVPEDSNVHLSKKNIKVGLCSEIDWDYTWGSSVGRKRQFLPSKEKLINNKLFE